MSPSDSRGDDAQSKWDHLLSSMIKIGRGSKYQDLKEPLALLGLSHVCQQDQVTLNELRSDPLAVAHKFAEAIEERLGLGGKPFSQHLLSALSQVEKPVISSWIESITRHSPDSSFCGWYTNKLDELEIAGHHDTPASVSRLIAALFADRTFGSIFDPSCGTGALLAAVAKNNEKAKLLGQEMNSEAWAWANMRLLVCKLKNINLSLGNALVDGPFADFDSSDEFDLVLTNPPFAMRLNDQIRSLLSLRSDEIFGKSTSSLSSETAYVHEIFRSLSKSGMAAVIIPNGFLFRRGNDQKLRDILIHKEDAVEAVIGLPAGLFAPSTNIETSIIILNRWKSCKKRKRHVLFIDARKLGRRENFRVFLDDDAAKRIQNAFIEGNEERGFSQLVAHEKLVGEECSLSPADYVKPLPSSPKVSFSDRRARIVELEEQYREMCEEYEALRSQLDQAAT